MIERVITILKQLVVKKEPYSLLNELIERGLKVGSNFNMQGGCIIDSSHCWHITIGDNVTLAPRVHILAHDASTKKFFNYVKIGKVRIGNNVFIGAGTIILPGVYIGDNVIVGAGSVVTHDIPEDSLAAGNPARVIGTCSGFIEKRKSEMKQFPCFGEEYTLRGNISHEMKDKMNDMMQDRFGYIE